jgi:hypothetical protein
LTSRNAADIEIFAYLETNHSAWVDFHNGLYSAFPAVSIQLSCLLAPKDLPWIRLRSIARFRSRLKLRFRACNFTKTRHLRGEATELCAILTASLTTARANWEAGQAARKAACRGKKRALSILVKFPEPDSSS